MRCETTPRAPAARRTCFPNATRWANWAAAAALGLCSASGWSAARIGPWAAGLLLLVGWSGLAWSLRRSATAAARRERRASAPCPALLAAGVELDSDPIPWEYDWESAAFTWIDPGAARLGYPLERWLEPGFFAQVIHEDDREATLAACARATEAGLHHVMRYRMTCADGSSLHIEDIVSVERDTRGRLRLSGVFYDRTGEREREAELQRVDAELSVQSERLQLALESSELGSWEANPQTREMRFDERWARLLGYTAGELPSDFTSWAERVHPEDLEHAREAFWGHLEGRAEHYWASFRLRHANGTWRWMLDRGRTVERDAEGRPLRVVGTRQDVTEDKQRELELLRLREQAEAASEAKTRFLANVSHEIRTPLTSILGYSEWLEEDLQREGASAAHLEKLAAVRTAGLHLHTILDDVLDLSKIEAGHMRVEVVPAELPELVAGVVEVMRQRAIEKGVELRAVCAGPIPASVRTDPTRLRQILINLLGNAAKFTERGHIELRVEAGERLRIAVEDTGVGMTAGQVQRLFHAFSQGDDSVARRFGGTGLGLTISKRLAVLMGGDVRLVRSERGAGTLFELDLPLAPCDGTEWTERVLPRATGPRPVQAQERLAGRILLVEDGAMNRRLIEAILTRAGAEVRSAAEGAEGLELFERARLAGEPFDLIVTDIQMPVMDGLAMTRIVRMSAPEMPVLALTANALEADRRRALEAGCVGYLCKPVDRTALVKECARHLPRGGRSAAA